MSERKRLYCLRCQNRFEADVDPKVTAERSCPSCGSNSVRIETPAAAKAHSAGAARESDLH